jgi:hypothetical protein
MDITPFIKVCCIYFCYKEFEMKRKWVLHCVPTGVLLFMLTFVFFLTGCSSTPQEMKQWSENKAFQHGKIQYLAYTERWDLVQRLLETGNYNNIDDLEPSLYYPSDGWSNYPYESREGTALMWAAYYGKIDMLDALLKKGANINLRDSQGRTAASIAYDRGQLAAYDFLKTKGARDFEPLQTQQAQSGSASSGSSASSAPSSRSYAVTVWYTYNGTRMSTPVIVTASSKDEAEREAERQWKNINGGNQSMKFEEAVGPMF